MIIGCKAKFLKVTLTKGDNALGPALQFLNVETNTGDIYSLLNICRTQYERQNAVSSYWN